MSIQVTLEYRDGNIHIKRGLYADNANELQGLGDYLLSAGHAKHSNESIASVESTTPEVPSVSPEEPSDNILRIADGVTSTPIRKRK